MQYEDAAYLRGQEKYLMTDDGKLFRSTERAKVKAELRVEKLKRLL